MTKNIFFVLFILSISGVACKKQPNNEPLVRLPFISKVTVEINPISYYLTLPNSSVNVSATIITDSGAVLTSVQWRKLAGPANDKILSPNSLATRIDDLMFGMYVFQCKVIERSGKYDSATCVIAVLNPAAAQEQQVVLKDQKWASGPWEEYVMMNLTELTPPGYVLKTVQIKIDCDTVFKQIPHFTNNPNAPYIHWLEYSSSKLWVTISRSYTLPGVCTLVDDSLDVKLVFSKP